MTAKILVMISMSSHQITNEIFLLPLKQEIILIKRHNQNSKLHQITSYLFQLRKFKNYNFTTAVNCTFKVKKRKKEKVH